MSKPLKEYVASKLDFCGLWRQCGGGEECLINVVECKLGAALDSTDVDRLWVRAEMTKYKEGAMIGEAFEIVMPKKGYIFRPDTIYPISEKEVSPLILELSGAVYGSSPLKQQPVIFPDITQLTTSSIVAPMEMLTPKAVSKLLADSDIWSEALGGLQSKQAEHAKLVDSNQAAKGFTVDAEGKEFAGAIDVSNESAWKRFRERCSILRENKKSSCPNE